MRLSIRYWPQATRWSTKLLQPRSPLSPVTWTSHRHSDAIGKLRCNNPVHSLLLLIATVVCLLAGLSIESTAFPVERRLELKDAVVELFDHAFDSYMRYAYPHDELMPLSCTGRIRGVTPSRGDIDDILGNFSLSLVDSLDSLYILGKLEAFESAVKTVISTVRFDTDVVVSVFETNIRMVGGLLSAHVLSVEARDSNRTGMSWYRDELLRLADDVGSRLLPAFESSTGIPFSRVNLRRGLDGVPSEKTTCTACAGSMLLEMATLSRLTGKPVYENKARKALFALWERRSRYTNLMGSIVNVDSGEWIRRDSSAGAGSDSYYEYLLKSYILLGDVELYHRFMQHYESLTRYQVRDGLFIEVPMNSPLSPSRNLVDALSAFWPGIQTLIGDLAPAVRAHEMLHGLVRKFRFLPEAFTVGPEFRAFWTQHPLRPEFAESTYFLYKATGDPHYLEVGERIYHALNETCRVNCGLAGISDVNTLAMSDQMDSYVLAETLKYLFLLFAEPADLPINLERYVFSTEGHPFPLYIATMGDNNGRSIKNKNLRLTLLNSTTCPNHAVITMEDLPKWANQIRSQVWADQPHLSMFLSGAAEPAGPTTAAPPMTVLKTTPIFPQQFYNEEIIRKTATMLGEPSTAGLYGTMKPLVAAAEFNVENPEHLQLIQRMGIVLMNTEGKAQLWHHPDRADNLELSGAGVAFLRDLVAIQLQLAKESQQQCPSDGGIQLKPHQFWILSTPFCGNSSYLVGPAQFGYRFTEADAAPIIGRLSRGTTEDSCVNHPIPPGDRLQPLKGCIAIVRRGGCMFVEKARVVQALGAIGLIVVDSEQGSSQSKSQFFALSGDQDPSDIVIPVVFMFDVEGSRILRHVDEADKSTSGPLFGMIWRQPISSLEEADQVGRLRERRCKTDAQEQDIPGGKENYVNIDDDGAVQQITEQEPLQFCSDDDSVVPCGDSSSSQVSVNDDDNAKGEAADSGSNKP